METNAVGHTVRVGNHTMTPEEAAAGAPLRLPYVDEDGAPVDPDEVTITLRAPDGTGLRYAWPTVDVGDEGLVQQEETGRFYVDVTPAGDADGVWFWASSGGMSGGTAVTDQDVFYVKRPIAGP